MKQIREETTKYFKFENYDDMYAFWMKYGMENVDIRVETDDTEIVVLDMKEDEAEFSLCTADCSEQRVYWAPKEEIDKCGVDGFEGSVTRITHLDVETTEGTIERITISSTNSDSGDIDETDFEFIDDELDEDDYPEGAEICPEDDDWDDDDWDDDDDDDEEEDELR